MPKPEGGAPVACELCTIVPSLGSWNKVENHILKLCKIEITTLFSRFLLIELLTYVNSVNVLPPLCIILVIVQVELVFQTAKHHDRSREPEYTADPTSIQTTTELHSITAGAGKAGICIKS